MLEPLWTLLDRWLWSNASQGVLPSARLLRLLRYPYAILRDLSRGQINLRAMSLVFTTMLALVPLLAFIFAILKVFGAHRDLEPIVFEFFRPLGRSATDLTARIMEFADNVSTGIVGSVGLVLLLWTLIGTIQKVEDSFNYVWHVERARGFARRITEYIALLIVGPLLLVGFISLAHQALDSGPLGALAPYAMVSVLFMGLYRFVPNTHVRWRAALAGGVVAGLLWATVGRIFTELVVYTSRLTLVYAGFAVIVAALLWAYFGWLILLVGAQLTFYLQNPNYLRLGLVELRLSNVEREDLALRIMYLVGRSHARGKRWRSNALAGELGLPGVAVSQVVAALEAAGMLIRTELGELSPARDIGHIEVRSILEVARSQRTGHTPIREMSWPAVDQLEAELSHAWRDRCGNRTLRDLVEADSLAGDRQPIDQH